MALTPLRAMVRKDLQIFFTDRRAVIMSFAAPIAIASFFGAIFPGDRGSREPARIPIHVVDEDAGTISTSVIDGLRKDRSLLLRVGAADEARAAVQRGRSAVAVIIPKGFGEAARRAFLAGRTRPQLDVLYDPSRSAELAMVRGILTEHILQVVSQDVLPGRGFSRPYQVREEPLTARSGVPYNGYAHSFAGMGVQFLLLAAVDLGLGVLLERQRGLWKRLRSAPVSRRTLLGARVASGTLITLSTLLVSFGFAMLVFGVRIEGSVVGFLGVAVACALMASTFGLLLAAVGGSPGATRGVAIFAVLILSMLGGAWVPTFIFPAWLQELTVIVPTRWAVDGLDAMTWRGLGLHGAVAPVLVLLAFAAVFGALAVTRFRWEES